MRGLELTLSHDLKDAYELGVGAGRILLGHLDVEVRYECDAAPWSRCSEDIIITPEVKGPQALWVDVKSEGLNYDVEGKIAVDQEEGSRDILIKVKKGRGQGYAKLRYAVYVNVPEAEIQSPLVLALYSVNTKTSERKLIGNPIQLTINVIKPFDVQKVNVYPLELFPSDKIGIYIRILGLFEGKLAYKLVYKGKTHVKEYAVKRYDMLEIRDEVEAREEGNSLKVLLEAPQLFYKEERMFKLTVLKPPRVELRELELLDKPTIGSTVALKLSLWNRSAATEVTASIACLIYEHRLNVQVTIPAGEARSLRLETPPLTVKSKEVIRGLIRIVETPGGYIIQRELELSPPLELDVKAQLDAKELRMFSSETKQGRIVLINNTNSFVRFAVTKVVTGSANVKFSENAFKIYPNSIGYANFYVSPSVIGEGTVELHLDAFIDEVKVSEFTLLVPIRVSPSFKVLDAECEGLINKYVLKGQDVSLLLRIECYAEMPVSIHVDSEELSFASKETVLVKGLNEVRLVAEVLEMSPLEITLTDGVHSERIPLDLVVTKPLVDLKLLTPEIYGGLKNTITLVITNLHNKDIAWSLECKNSKGLKLSSEESCLEFDPLLPYEKREVTLDAIGLTKGPAELDLSVKTRFMTEFNSQDFNFKLKVVDPVEVQVDNDAGSKVILPHPLVKGLEDRNLTFRSKLRIRNISNDIIEAIDVNIVPSDSLVKAECDRSSIKFLIKDSMEDLSCIIRIPFNYFLEVVKVGYLLSINSSYNVRGTLMELPVSRENYVVVTYDGMGFKKECPYPHRFTNGCVSVYMPLTQADDLFQRIQEYGTPTEVSKLLASFIRGLRRKLANIKRSDSCWNLLIRMLYTLIFDGLEREKRNFKEEVDALKDKVGNIIIVPAILWKYVLYKLIDLNLNIKMPSEFERGLVYIAGGSYSFNNKFYENLIKALIEDSNDASIRLRETIEGDYSMISPVLLTYALAKGALLVYSEEVSKRLWESGQYDKYLIYLTLTDVSWSDKREELGRLNDLMLDRDLSEVCYAALALLYRKLIVEMPERCWGV
jgi:hypothetical protein